MQKTLVLRCEPIKGIQLHTGIQDAALPLTSTACLLRTSFIGGGLASHMLPAFQSWWRPRQGSGDTSIRESWYAAGWVLRWSTHMLQSLALVHSLGSLIAYLHV